MEIFRQHYNIDAIFIPTSGSGLTAGVTAFIKQVCPEVKVIGMQTDDSYCMK